MDRCQLFNQPSYLPIFDNFHTFEKATVGITGGRGVLGGILVKRFKSANIKVSAFEGDVTNPGDLWAWFSKHSFTHFFHFAAKVPVSFVKTNLVYSYEVNAISNFHVCKCIASTQEHVWSFFPSSSHVYPHNTGSNILNLVSEQVEPSPASLYGATKLQGEAPVRLLLKELKRPFCIGRIFSFSHQSQNNSYLIPGLIDKIRSAGTGSTVDVTNPDSVRDIMDAESVLDAILWLAYEKAEGIFNIGTGNGKTIRNIALELARKENKILVIRGENTQEPNGIVADVGLIQTLVRSHLKNGR